MSKFQNHDYNEDGLNDRFKFHIAFRAKDSSKIKSIKIALFFKYLFKVKFDGEIFANCLMDIDTSIGASYIKINGYLNLKQKAPISSNYLTELIHKIFIIFYFKNFILFY